MLVLVIGGFSKSAFLHMRLSWACPRCLKKKIRPSAGLPGPDWGADSLHQHRKQFSEHMNEGLNIVPIYIHLPFQVLFPRFAAYHCRY